MPTESKVDKVDLVTGARELARTPMEVHQFARRATELLRQLCDEVERLREQWNTRFNTLCGLCGKRYLGPRDEYLHGYGRCDEKVSNAD